MTCCRTASSLSALLATTALLAGCSHHYYYAAPPPPPPPVYQPAPALLDLAARNGFNDGVRDGARDSYYGYRPDARRTSAYHDAPGYDANLGPAEPYVNEFRLSYLRGYDKGFYHR